MNQKYMVLVDSTCHNLRRLALAVASQKPLLLEGPTGCGKTNLVEFMGSLTGHTTAKQIIKIQLGDQTDSKVRENSVSLNLMGYSEISAAVLEESLHTLKKTTLFL